MSGSIRQPGQAIWVRTRRPGAARKTVLPEQLKEAPPVYFRQLGRLADVSTSSCKRIFKISLFKLANHSRLLGFERFRSRRHRLIEALNFDVLYQISPIQNDCTLQNVFQFTDVAGPV